MFKKLLSTKAIKFSIALCLLSALFACDNVPPKFLNTDITGSTAFNPNFELVDHLGNVRHLADFKGKVAIIFFGFTQCPDVCPTTLNEIKEALPQFNIVNEDFGASGVLFKNVNF